MMVALLIYGCIGLFVGWSVWRATAGTWSSGSLWAHVARAVLLSVAAGALRPGSLLIALGLQHPTTRRLIYRFIDGDTP